MCCGDPWNMRVASHLGRWHVLPGNIREHFVLYIGVCVWRANWFLWVLYSALSGYIFYYLWIEAWNRPHVQVVSAEATCFVLASSLMTCTWGRFHYRIPQQCRCELITCTPVEKSTRCSSLASISIVSLGLGIDNPCRIVFFLILRMNKCLERVIDQHFWNPGVFS